MLPMFLASMGAAAAWLGLIEGISDGLSSFAKMASGYYTDRLARRKPVAICGYLVTTLGTGAIGLASSASHVLAARSMAWLGRGVRTPVRKALLAGSVERNSYGRAFGFERMMDTIGAIVGPATALLLLQTTHSHYPAAFAWTLLPGLLAVVSMSLLVKEKERKDIPHVAFSESLRTLPSSFRRYLVAVGLFGSGDFAHTLLILLATQKLAPALGMAKAASLAAGLYMLHNGLYAVFSFASGWLADHYDKRRILSGGYVLAAVMTLCVISLPLTIWSLVLIFILGGIYIGIEETLEDSLCAELVGDAQKGMAFGLMATVNGVGDFISSMTVGILWSNFGTTIAFGYSTVLFIAGALLLIRDRAHPAAAT